MIFIINYEHKLLRNTTFHGHKSLMLGRPDPSPFLREGCGYARLIAVKTYKTWVFYTFATFAFAKFRVHQTLHLAATPPLLRSCKRHAPQSVVYCAVYNGS